MRNHKKTALVIALTSAAILSGAVEAAQISAAGFATTSSPTSSSNNNFTMLNGTGGFIGGNTDVAMTWDGTVFNSNSDYTGPGGTSNMTLFAYAWFGYMWSAHDVQVFAPGSYSFNTALGGGNPEAGIQSLTIGVGQLGAHMLFDWNGNNNIDVSVLWNANGVFGTTAAQRTLTGTAVWNAVSVDGDGLGGPGIKMALGGPFQNSQANFNLNGISPTYLDADYMPTAVPLPAAFWLLGSGLIGMVGVARRKRK